MLRRCESRRAQRWKHSFRPIVTLVGLGPTVRDQGDSMFQAFVEE